MSSITNGIFGGGKGLDFDAKNAQLEDTGLGKDQSLQTYGNVQTGLTNQQNFLDAIAKQNGVQNQSNVFNQMQGVANGTGPNPAQAQLAQATQANVANQAAMMAGQRGAGSNPALIARQAAMAGSNAQQQSAGQAATLQSQQQLAALNQMGGIANNQVATQANATNSYSNAANQANQNVLGAIAAKNNALVGNASQQNAANAAVAGHAAGAQTGIMGTLMGAAGKGIGMLGGGGGGSPGAIGGGGTDVSGGVGDAGGIVGDGTMMAAAGGMVQRKYAEGGDVQQTGELPETVPVKAPSNFEQQQSSMQPQLATIPGAMGVAGAVTGPQSFVGQSQGGGGSTNMGDQALNGINGGLKGGGLGSNFGPVGAVVGGGVGAVSGASKENAKGEGYGGSDFNWGGAGQGAASGAMSGAAIGSIFPGIGNVVGGVAGGLIGGVVGGLHHDGNTKAKGGTVSNMPESHIGKHFSKLAQGGPVPALVSPGEKYLDPRAVQQVKQGANPMKIGETIPGKPQVGGAKNSYANDTVPKTLREGGIVVPRSVTKSNDADKKAKAFVEAVLARKGKGLPKK